MKKNLELAVAGMLILAIGCGRTEVEPAPVEPTQEPHNEPVIITSSPKAEIPEDPDLVKYFKAKKWELDSSGGFEGAVTLRVETSGPLGAPTPLTKEEVETIAKSKAIEFLDLSNTTVLDESLSDLVKIPTLIGIAVRSKPMTAKTIKILSGNQNLRNVVLWNCSLGDDAIKELAALKNLQKLHIRYDNLNPQNPFTGVGLRDLATIKSMRSINLEFCDGIDDKGAAALAEFEALERLYLSTSKMTPAGFKKIILKRVPPDFLFPSRLLDDESLAILIDKNWFLGDPSAPKSAKQVSSIDLSQSQVTSKGVALLNQFSGLHDLNLSGTLVTDEGLAHLAGFSKLEILRLDGTSITAKGLSALSGLPLKTLSLRHCDLTEESFQKIGAIKSLETLDVSARDAKTPASWNPKWVRHLSELKILKSLDLSHSSFDDDAAAALGELKSLEVVQISKTKVSDSGLKKLGSLPKLKEVWLSDSDVSAEGREAFKQSYPQVRTY